MNVKKRNSTIDLLKFIYAVVVVIFHGRKLAYNDEFTWLQSGYLAVEFFFIVSGYLMMSAASRVYAKDDIKIGEETFSFLSHKIKGLYPSILFAYVCTLAAIIFTAKEPIKAGEIVSSVWELFLLRMSGIQGRAINTITWYISAMMICMLFLYPLILKFKEDFAYIGAPLLAIFGLGYLSQTGALTSPEKWMGLVYRGIIRATAELSIGCIVYLCVQKLKAVTLTKLTSVLLFVLQWGCVFASLYISNIPGSDMGYVCVLFMAVAVTLGFSGVTDNYIYIGTKQSRVGADMFYTRQIQPASLFKSLLFARYFSVFQISS